MKKFFMYLSVVLVLLGTIFTYILYSEGAFDTTSTQVLNTAETSMKCESGKCATGKCGGK